MTNRTESKFRLQIPSPPESWSEFERLCWSLWMNVWADPETQRHGRQGSAQKGVDIFGRTEGKQKWAAVQYKWKENFTEKKLTSAEIEAEIQNANAWVKDYFVGRLKSQLKLIKPSEFTEILLLAIENPTVYEDLKIMLEAYSGELGKRAVAFVNASRESEFHLRNPFLASKYLSKMVALTGYSDHKNGKLIVNFVEEILHARSESFITLLPVLELLGRTGIPDAKVVYEKYIGCDIDA